MSYIRLTTLGDATDFNIQRTSQFDDLTRVSGINLSG